jgi:hypothetical protein
MGIGALNYQGVKGGLKLNDVIEEFKYAYKGQQIKAGDFVNYINGVAGQTTGTSTPVHYSQYTRWGSAVLIDENKFLVAYYYFISGSSTTYYCATTVGTIEGNSITFGAEYVFATVALNLIDTCLVEKNKVLIAYQSNGANDHLALIVATISDGVVSFGSSITIGNKTYSHSVCLVDTNKVLVTYANGSNRGYAYVATISGNTITLGSSVCFYNYSVTTQIDTQKIGTNKALISFYHQTSSSNAYLMVATISGTTSSFGSSYKISSTNQATYPILALIDTNKFLVQYNNATNQTGCVVVATISGTSVSLGTEYMFNSGYTFYQSMGVLETNKVLISYEDRSASMYGMSIIAVVSGNSVTFGDEYNFNAGSTETTNSVVIDKNKVLLVYRNNANSSSITAQIVGVSDTTISDTVVITEYEQQVTLATEPPFDGIALSSGIGGDDTGHNQQVKIAKPESEKIIEFNNSIVPIEWSVSADGLSATATNEYGEWRINASNVEAYTYGVDRAFDGDDGTEYHAQTSKTTHVQLHCPNNVSIKPTEISIIYQLCGDSSNSNLLQGYTTEGTWVDIATIPGYDDSSIHTNAFEVSDDTYYSAFDFYAKSYGSYYACRVFDFKINSGTVKKIIY